MNYVETPDGTIAVNDKGYPLSEVPDGYDISRFDFEELHRVCYLSTADCGNTWGICDVGYWDNEGQYHAPCNRPASYRSN